MKRLCTGIVLVWALVASVSVAQDELKIVTSSAAGMIERFAAEELQSYLERVCGRRFVIATERVDGRVNLIIAADPALASLGPDGFHIQSRGNDLLFNGGEPRGALYAVYEFLEKHLGVRWFGSDANDEVIPNRSPSEIAAIIARGINDKQTPSFQFREVSLNRGGPTQLAQLAKLRLNAVMTGYGVSDTFREQTLPELRKRGVDLVMGGHDTYQRFLPPKPHFVEHPEWSILHRGARVGTNTLAGAATFCTSNKDAMAVFLANLVEHVKTRPTVKYLYPWPSDAARWCACEPCSKTPVADRLLALDIAIAQAVHRARPDVTVIHFAYGTHVAAPTALRPPKEMAVSFSAWGRDFACAMEDKQTPKDWRDALAIWAGICRETGSPLFIHSKFLRLYGVGFVLMPYAVVPRDMKFYKRTGVSGFDFHRAPLGWWTKGLNDAVVAKLAWNSDADVGAIVEDYFRTYWAPVAAEVRTIFESVENALPNRGYWKTSTNPNMFHTRLENETLRVTLPGQSFAAGFLEDVAGYNDHSIAELRESLARIRALESRPLDATTARRLAKLATAFDYVLLQREAVRLFVQLQKQPFPLPASATKNLESLQEQLRLVAELEAIEQRIKTLCTPENRSSGVLWDNGQDRLDAVTEWRKFIEERRKTDKGQSQLSTRDK